MAQAEHPIITRRSLIAATAGSAVAASLPALAEAPDPVCALIAAHKAACRRHEQVCYLLSDLEGEIPRERRKEWFHDDRAKGVGVNDDPRWRAAKTEYWATSEADNKAAWVLAHARPVTLAGAVALLCYAHDYEAEGHDWPCDPPEDDERESDWHGVFYLNLAGALERMARK